MDALSTPPPFRRHTSREQQCRPTCGSSCLLAISSHDGRSKSERIYGMLGSQRSCSGWLIERERLGEASHPEGGPGTLQHGPERRRIPQCKTTPVFGLIIARQ